MPPCSPSRARPARISFTRRIAVQDAPRKPISSSSKGSRLGRSDGTVEARVLLAAGGAAVAASPLARAVAASAASFEPVALPAPAKSGLEHIILVTMENRSFDHLMGWLPGADGKQAGLSYLDPNGVSHATHPLAPDFQGCALPRPGPLLRRRPRRVQRRRLRRLPARRQRPLRDRLLPAAGPARSSARPLRDWTVCDHYFAAILGPTFPNRLYLHAGATDRIENTFAESALPTIWDRLAAKGVSAAYYYSNLPSCCSGATSTRRSSARTRSSSPTAAPGSCRRSRTSTRSSPAPTRAPPRTIIRTPTSARARIS